MINVFLFLLKIMAFAFLGIILLGFIQAILYVILLTIISKKR